MAMLSARHLSRIRNRQIDFNVRTSFCSAVVWLQGLHRNKNMRSRDGSKHNAVVCFASIADGWSDKKIGETAQNLRVPVPEARLPFLGFVRSLVLKQLICGSVAGGVSSVASSPFGLLKTKVVAHRGGNTTQEVVRDISHKQGLRSLIPSSLSAWLLSISIASLKRGVQFVTFEAVKRSEQRRHVQDPKVIPFIPREASIATLSGALSAVTALLATYPFATIPDRVILQSKDYPSTFQAIAKVLREEGIPGLYRGFGPQLLQMVPNAAAEFYLYETLRSKVMNKVSREIGPLQSLVIGAAAGAFSTTLTYPLELARKELSMSAVASSPYAFNSTWQALRTISAREGFRGFYRGLELELMQIVPNTAVSFLVYEIMKRALVASHEEKRSEVKDGP